MSGNDTYYSWRANKRSETARKLQIVPFVITIASVGLAGIAGIAEFGDKNFGGPLTPNELAQYGSLAAIPYFILMAYRYGQFAYMNQSPFLDKESVVRLLLPLKLTQ